MCVDELDWQGLNPYFIGLSILIWVLLTLISIALVVSILILLDYLFLLSGINPLINTADRMSQSLFYWIIYSYVVLKSLTENIIRRSQSLFYWIIYSYPFCRESPLFIIATEFFSDIKIDFFLIFLVFFF